MNIFILLFMALLIIVAISLTYYSLSNLEKKQKISFIVVTFAIIYLLVSIVYAISSKTDETKIQVAEAARNFIVFTFVPVNYILTVPVLAKSYSKYKKEKSKLIAFRNRTIVIGALLVILLIMEYFYFQDIQNGIMKIIER